MSQTIISSISVVYAFVLTFALAQRAPKHLPIWLSGITRVGIFSASGYLLWINAVLLFSVSIQPLYVHIPIGCIIIGFLLNTAWSKRQHEQQAKNSYQRKHAWPRKKNWRRTSDVEGIGKPDELLNWNQSWPKRSLMVAGMQFSGWLLLFLSVLLLLQLGFLVLLPIQWLTILVSTLLTVFLFWGVLIVGITYYMLDQNPFWPEH